jgi:hypothetical protein
MITIAAQKMGNKPASWGGDGVMFMDGRWWSMGLTGLHPYAGPVENVRQGPFPARKFGASPMAGVKFLNRRVEA